MDDSLAPPILPLNAFGIADPTGHRHGPFQGEYRSGIPAVLAAVVLSTVPILVLSVVGRGQLLSGVTAGVGT